MKPWERYAQEQAPAQDVEPAPAGPWARYQQEPQAEPPRFFDTAMGLGKQALRGLTLGYADEIEAAAAGLAGSAMGKGNFSDLYDASLRENRNEQKAFEERNPISSVGAQIAGGMLFPAGRLSGAKTMLGRVGGNALTGALLGGVTGFGEGEGVMGRLGSAGFGAATGAVLGAALPAAVEGIGAGARKVAPYLGLNVANTDAKRTLIRALQEGGESPASVKMQLDPITGQPMAIADVGGENVLGMAEAVARKPGPGMQAARDFVEARGGLNQSGRLQAEIDRAISSGDWKSTADDLIATRSRTAGPMYDAVRNDTTPVDVAPIIADIDARLTTAKGPIRDALRRARSMFMNRDGSPDTTLAGLHETKIALDAMMDRVGDKPIDNFARREVKGVQSQLLAAMDTASGGKYAAARDAFAGPSRARDAMDLGKSMLSGKDFDETAEAIGKMSASEKDFFRIGVARALDDAVKGKADNADIGKIKQIWGSQAVRERVRAAFDDPAEFKKFADFMDREMTMATTNATVNPRSGSITAKALMRAQDEPPSGPTFEAMRQALRGNPVGAIANIMPRPATPGLTSETAAEIAPYLFTLKPGDRARLVDELLKQQMRDQKVKRIADPVAKALLRGSVTGAVQLEN